jgi:hypothetical protein
MRHGAALLEQEGFENGVSTGVGGLGMLRGVLLSIASVGPIDSPFLATFFALGPPKLEDDSPAFVPLFFEMQGDGPFLV